MTIYPETAEGQMEKILYLMANGWSYPEAMAMSNDEVDCWCLAVAKWNNKKLAAMERDGRGV